MYFQKPINYSNKGQSSEKKIVLFGIDSTITGLVVVLLMGLIIFGDVKRIARVAEFLVPFMAAGYLLIAITIIAVNFERIPEIFTLIFKSAFGAEEMFGGILGSTIMWGVKRGLYANEAGQGTGAHPAAAAEVSHPAKQGLVQAFSIYLDVFLIVTATGYQKEVKDDEKKRAAN
jgi:alanine or glycine:cation symporter, AGCS family